MSRKLPKGTFSPQRDVRSCKSNLDMGNWDPYPELQNPKNCYGNNVENYSNGASKDCMIYKVEPNKIDTPYAPLQRSVIFNATPVRENYATPCCRPTPYNNLNQTWEEQKPYNL